MIEKNNKPIDTSIQQKRRGYENPRRIRSLDLKKGNKIGGWEVTDDNQFVSLENEDGFRIRLNSRTGEIGFDGGVKIKNTATPFSGVGGLSIEHDTGTLILEVGGSGEGIGNRYIVLRNADSSVYFALIDNDNGTYNFELVGLPSSNPGAGKLWRNGNVVTIGT